MILDLGHFCVFRATLGPMCHLDSHVCHGLRLADNKGMLLNPMTALIEEFVRGAVRAFDPSGALTQRDRKRPRPRTNQDAIRGDWNRVGRDITRVVSRLAYPTREKETK